MNLDTLAGCAPWMEPEEHAVHAAFVRAMAEELAARGVRWTPLVALRLDNVSVAYLMVRRTERGLEPDAGDEPAARDRLAAVEQSGKARERMAKMIKELEDACAKAGTPIDTCLADRMQPLLRRTEGVIEDALQFEVERREKEQASNAE